MSNNKIDIVKVIESKFGDKVPIQLGQLGTAAINTSNGLHRDVLKAMLEADEKTGITAITGLDLGANLGIIYHTHTKDGFFGIRAEVPKENPKIQTIVDIIPGAALHELEVTDLMGVVFEGNPSPPHFLLSENWPVGVYPLRKDVNVKEVKLDPSPKEGEKQPDRETSQNYHWTTAPCAFGAGKILDNC